VDLIDIGANLTHDSFDADRDDVVQRALDAGVKQMVLTGGSEQGSKDAVALARSGPGIFYATAGVHPHHASEYCDRVHQVLGELQALDIVVAAGECGLDYFRNLSPVDAQRSAFERQLDLAEASSLPVFLHQRDAHDDFVEILKPRLPGLSRAVAHCFTGEGNELLDYLDMGLYIGITGWICDERRGAHLRSIVSDIPLDKLMIETDAPYLLPRTLKPKPKSRRNEPMHLREVLRIVAEAFRLPESTIAEACTENSRHFFAI
jgi:TatD DNase family protein